jgi:hypothetical protein
VVDEPRRIVEERLREPVVVGVLERDRGEAVVRELVDRRVGIREQERRVGGDDELRAVETQLAQAAQQGQAALR